MLEASFLAHQRRISASFTCTENLFHPVISHNTGKNSRKSVHCCTGGHIFVSSSDVTCTENEVRKRAKARR